MASARRYRPIRLPLPDAPAPHHPRAKRVPLENVSTHRLQTQCRAHLRIIRDSVPHVAKAIDYCARRPNSGIFFFSFTFNQLEAACSGLDQIIEILERRIP